MAALWPRYPEYREEFRVGDLSSDSIRDIVKGFAERYPRLMRLLQEITLGELSQQYGDPENKRIYYRQNLVNQVWVSRYLRDRLR